MKKTKVNEPIFKPKQIYLFFIVLLGSLLLTLINSSLAWMGLFIIVTTITFGFLVVVYKNRNGILNDFKGIFNLIIISIVVVGTLWLILKIIGYILRFLINF